MMSSWSKFGLDVTLSLYKGATACTEDLSVSLHNITSKGDVPTFWPPRTYTGYNVDVSIPAPAFLNEFHKYSTFFLSSPINGGGKEEVL